jgi:hypothetical protein
MKTIALLVLFCAASYGADIMTTNITGDITAVVSEHQDKEGKPRVHRETLYRGKERILQITSRPDKQGKLVVASRSYFAGGKLVMAETDEDGDGIFEHVSVYGPATNDFELFVKQPDGSVKPESTKYVELIKKEGDVAAGEFLKLVDKPDRTEGDVAKSLNETHQKIRNLQKQAGPDKQ